MRFDRFNNSHVTGDETRERMIAETGAFLSWALTTREHVPRIPRRRVDAGGFADLLSRPLGRRVATRWWGRAIERIADHFER